MVSKRVRNLLTIYFLGMTCVHGDIFWRARGLIPQGFPDFAIFYMAGKVVSHSEGVHLYDERLQTTVTQSFAGPAAQNRGSIIPYYHPPFEAIFFAPLSGISFVKAYWCWFLLNLGLLAALPFVLRRRLQVLGELPWWFWVLSCLAFSPNFSALSEGQDSILILFAFSAAFAALSRSKDFRAGGWLGLGLCKYQFVLPFLIPYLFQHRKRIFVGFFTVVCLLVLAGAAVVGWKGWISYPHFVWYADNTTKYVWNSGFGNTPNLRGLVFSLLPDSHPRLREWFLIATSSLVIAAVCRVFPGSKLGLGAGFQLGFALNLLASILVSYHALSHDLCLLWLVIVLTLDSLLTQPPLARPVRALLFACTAVLYFSPLYLAVLFWYGKLYWMTWVLLVFFVLLLVSVARPELSDPDPREPKLATVAQ